MAELTVSKRKHDLKYKLEIITRCANGESIHFISQSEDLSRVVIYRWLKNKDIIKANVFSQRPRFRYSGQNNSIYRLKGSPFEDIVLYIEGLLSGDWCLSNEELKEKALRYALSNVNANPMYASFKASRNFIGSARWKFFNGLFPELYVMPSELKTLKKGGVKSAGDGLFSNFEYNADSMIGFFIGSIINITQYNQNIKNGGTKIGYAISLGNGIVIDCYEHMLRGECKVSKANDPYGTAKYLKNGARAQPNARLSFEYRGYQQFLNLQMGTPNYRVFLVAGRAREEFETDEAFKTYKTNFKIKKNTEILFDYGEDYWRPPTSESS